MAWIGLPPSLRLDPTIHYHSHLWQFNCFETRVKGVGRDFKLEDSNDLVLTVFGDTNQILPSFPPKVLMGYHYQINIKILNDNKLIWCVPLLQHQGQGTVS